MDVREDNFDDLGRLWRSQPTASAFDGKEILMQVKEKASKLERTLFWRDVREIAAAVLALSVMGAVSWQAPGWLPKAGAVFLAGCLVYVVARLLGPRRNDRRIREDAPLVARIETELHKVETQAELLRTVRSWYILPISIGGTIWVATLIPSVPLPSGALLPALGLVVLASGLIFLLVGWMVEKLNEQALRRSLVPYRDELREMLEQARM